ncbi:MAG: adenylate/guanylate cyclase domain-containing protein [Treponema sp.]|jgi:adenylate cyclase|nr:adenylate/guanylate cyclase domain-containing protein [Treponema sp.]
MSAEKKYRERRGGVRVRFSIGAKLIVIITVIVLLSLGSITALVSWLVREDLKVSAEDNNFEVNRRAAVETEQTLENMRKFSLMFIRTAAVLPEKGSLPESSDMVQKEAEYFFAQNPQIAALFLGGAGRPSGGWRDHVLVNERFFLSRGISVSSAESYRDANQKTINNAAAGQTVILNASTWFNTSLTALFFPVEGNGGCVLFSPENLNESFGLGTNLSYLINADGDVVADADPETVKNGLNLADKDFIRAIFASPDRNKQMLLELDVQTAWRNTAGQDTLQALWKKINYNIQPAMDTVFRLLRIEQQKRNVRTRAAAAQARYYLAYTRLNTAGCIVITGIEYDKVFEGIVATTRRNLYLTAAVVCISIMFIWFFAKSISVPLKTLAAVARTVEGGRFEMELTPKSRDEIGVLTSSFRRMCTALGIFGRFTNRDIAVRAMRGQIKPGGLPKHATIFFSDIRGFTEKSENFTKAFGNDASDRIVYWLNEYLTEMVKCVEETGGVVDKFIGDAVMAHWGTAYTAGSPREDAFNCVKAALLMRSALRKMNRNREEKNWGNPPIRIGCGINTGIVTAGQIGSELRMEYTVIGDPVNLASRVEALNKPLGTDILITEDTWNLLKDKLIVEEMPSVTVKGKEKPVRLFAVVNFTSVASGFRTLAEVRKRLGIEPPDISKADVNAEEHKYKIGEK